MEFPTDASDQFIAEFMEYAFPHSFDMRGEPVIGNGVSSRQYVIHQVERLCKKQGITGYLEQVVDKNGDLQSNWQDSSPQMVESARLDALMVRYYGQRGHLVSNERYIHMQPRFDKFAKDDAINAYLEHVAFKRKLQTLADLATED